MQGFINCLALALEYYAMNFFFAEGFVKGKALCKWLTKEDAGTGYLILDGVSRFKIIFSNHTLSQYQVSSIEYHSDCVSLLP